jgi:hypothetical protein
VSLGGGGHRRAAASGPSAREGLYEKVYWYDAVFTNTLELIAIRQGPELPVSAGILALVAGDAFAATEGCTQDAGTPDQCPVLVFNWETRQTWTLHERPGRFLMRPWQSTARGSSSRKTRRTMRSRRLMSRASCCLPPPSSRGSRRDGEAH